MQILHGLSEHHRAAAAALYWQAFGGKLGAVMGPQPRALAYLARVMRLDMCIGAVVGDQLVGVVGLQSATGSFAGGTAGDFRAIYGWLRGLWRLPALIWVGGGSAAPQILMIDGFSVALQARSQGVGAALLHAVLTHAQEMGYAAVHLDVIDSNWRARAFYARHGFTLHKRRSIWPLGTIFGFRAVLRLSHNLGHSVFRSI